MDRVNTKLFLLVSETGSFHKTAEAMGYSQAAISYAVAAMEQDLGLTLFIREHDGVHLSSEGEALLPLMRQQEAWERRLQQTVGELQQLDQGSLRVLIFDSISIHWIPGILSRFCHDFPGIKIELISEEDSVRAEQMVSGGEVDCGFFLTDVRPGLDIFPLREESLLAIMAPDHPLAGQDCFPIAEIDRHPYISMKYEEHTDVGKLFRSRGIRPQTVFRMDNDYAAMAMVSAGLGFGIFPELLLLDAPFPLRMLPFDEPQKRTISIGTRSIDSATRACRKFIRYTRDWIAEQDGQ